MCGIFGGIGITENEAEKAINLIKRGDDGIQVNKLPDNIIFASRRHLVKNSGNETVDKKSDQPYFSENRNIAIIFNGEFYNFDLFKQNLKKKNISFKSSGDTEVFLKLYEKNGIDFIYNKEIDSLFALAIYDKSRGKIIITRDFPGRIPLYYYYDKEKFIFSSELKGFRGVNKISLQDPIELEPGYYLEYDIKEKKIKKTKFFTPETSKIKKESDILEIGKNLHKILDESAKNRTMGDVPICTMLSGGIDSVLTTFYVFKNIDFKNIGYQPTSYVFSVKDYESMDVIKARLAAESFKSINLKLIEINATKEEIIEDTPRIIETFEMRKIKALSFYPLPIYWYLAPQMRKDGFKVTIGGHGVDELLGAYDSWKELNKPHDVQIRSASRLAFINNIYSNMLKRASIIFMNRGPVEARFPFLNHKICEFMLSIDKKWLSLNQKNAEILIKLIDKKNISSLKNIKNTLSKYIDDKNNFEKDFSEKEKNDLKKIFWKFPLIVSSYIASEESFLSFDQVFNPKLRGQHGAGLTSLEKDIVNNYSNLGNTDTEIFKKMSAESFK
mgnify:CR=1 FL=1|tara:strand:- start:2360 stop:4030 length:1671 start_codon:yes stop_codon:yes gene_type:complete